MGRLSNKNKTTTRLNVKRVIFITAIAGVSISTTLILIFGTGGALITSKNSMAAPPPPSGNNASSLGVAPKGPGGVGTIDGSSSLKIWYRTDFGMTVSNGQISSWTNSAGVPELDLVQTAGNKPGVVTNAINGHSEVSFTSNAHWLKTAQGSLTTSNFVTNQASTFCVNKADVTNQSSSLYTTEPLVGNSRFSNHIPWGGNVYYDIGTCCSQDARIQVNNVSTVTNYNIWTYDAKQSTGKQLYQNGVLLQSRPNTSNYTSHSTQRFRIGRNYKGDVTEVIVFKEKINITERYIIDNYLSSKFDIALATHDLYSHDNGVGIYDHDLAGIGRTSSNDSHEDSQGTGIVRVRNPQDLNDNEYLFWANNDGVVSFTNTSDLPNDVDNTLARTWKVSELDNNGSAVDVGAVDLIFDLSGLGNIDTNELKLIIDTDLDGSFANETPITGATNPEGNLFSFSGVTQIEDNVIFTLGIGSSSALPIELSEFTAALIDDEYVSIQWTTETERNNDYFTIEKSIDAEHFEAIGTVHGAGNTTEKKYYSFDDHDLFNGIAYYRLRQTDYDGKTETFDPRSVEYQVDAEAMEILSIGPNPFIDQFTLKYNSISSARIEFVILNMGGTIVHSENLIANEGENQVTYKKGYELNRGLYIVTLADESGNRVSKKIIKK